MTHPIRIEKPLYYIKGEAYEDVNEIIVDRKDIVYIERTDTCNALFIRVEEEGEVISSRYVVSNDSLEYVIRQMQAYLNEG